MKTPIKVLTTIMCALLLAVQPIEYSDINTAQITASAETGIYENKLLYAIENEQVSITGWLNGVESTLEIPEEIAELPVVRITGTAFTGCTAITSVTVPETVKQIESGAFARCSNLMEIVVDGENTAYSSRGGVLLDKYGTCLLRCPGGITGDKFYFPLDVSTIADTAFQGCINLTKVTVPQNVEFIGNNAFADCTALESVIISDSVTKIGGYTFSGCTSLKTTKLPNGIEKLPEGIFYNCTSLYTIELPQSVQFAENYCFANCTSLKTVSLNEGLKILGDGMFMNCNSVYELNLPEGLEGIGTSCFKNCTGFREMVVPSSVKFIGEYAFNDCTALGSIVLSDNLERIEKNTFEDCVSLGTINIPSNVNYVAGMAFLGCSSIVNVTADENSTFFVSEQGILMTADRSTLVYYPSGKQNQRYTIPESVITVGEGAFVSCKGITDLVIPDTVLTVGEYALYDADSIHSVTLSKNISEIPQQFFSRCDSLRSVVIPESVTEIKRSAFSNCKNLNSVSLGKKIESIGQRAFFGCNLNSITIPSSVKIIGDNALGYTSSDSGNKLIPITGFAISGSRSSAAETYALKNGFPFIDVGSVVDNTTTTTIEPEVATTTTTCNMGEVSSVIPGDVDDDNVVSIADAVFVLRYYSMTGAGLSVSFEALSPGCTEDRALQAADANTDGQITLSDCTYILKTYAEGAAS